MGTNLALLHVLWVLVSGALLPQRGALFPALKALGFSDAATRRAWGAFRKGAWHISELLGVWRAHVEAQAEWRVHRHEGYRVVTVDGTAFWRPHLKRCPSQHFHAVIMGLVGEVGELGGQRLALPRALERVRPHDGRETRLWASLLGQVKRHLADDEVAVLDAGVKVQEVQAAEIDRYVLRLPTNFTARRNVPAPYRGQGRHPVYGAWVRPLPRTFKGKVIAATPPDRVESRQAEGRTITAQVWDSLVLSGVKPHPHAKTFPVYAIHDPAYPQPWLLATPLRLQPITVKAIYTDRWPGEPIPLAAKQRGRAHRQFVHAPESIQPLPELALLAGSILSFLAATMPLSPTGFWDTHPKRTPGRCRRRLTSQPFPLPSPLPEQFRKKESFTAHLPKGIDAVHMSIARARQRFSAQVSRPSSGPI